MIYGIGRNYAAHARELGNSAPKTAPMVFLKPDAGIVHSGEKIFLPEFSNNVQFEVELAFRFGADLKPSEICVANDLTARDKQKEAQEAGTPWTLAKGFKQSCGLGNWIPVGRKKFDSFELRLTQNDKVAQHGFTKDMIFSVEDLCAYLIATFPVKPGDIVLTGTPEGVAAIKPGDFITIELIQPENNQVISRAQWTFSSHKDNL